MSQKITIIKGDGIGPEIMDATLRVLEHLNLDFSYNYQLAGLAALDVAGDLLPEETLDAIEKNKICLKGFVFFSGKYLLRVKKRGIFVFPNNQKETPQKKDKS